MGCSSCPACTVKQMKAFLEYKHLPVTGNKKAQFIARIEEKFPGSKEGAAE